MIIFPDTNLFLHFRDPRELDWSAVTQDQDIRLVVGRTVQKEIQKKRFELRNRPQTRARRYAKLLGDMAGGAPRVEREANPRVELCYVARPVGWIAPPDLAEGWGDDQLVADALAYRSANPCVDVAVLSDDPEVIATAHAHNVIVMRAPDDWELPPETSPEQRENVQLKETVRKLSRQGPAMAFTFEEAGANGRLAFTAIRRPPPQPEAVEALIARVLTANPEASGFDRIDDRLANADRYLVPTQDAIDAYRTRHRGWRDGLRPQIDAAIEAVGVDHVLFRLTGRLTNIGVEYARDLLISIEVSDGLRLVESDELADQAEVEITPAKAAPPAPRPTLKPMPRPQSPYGLGHLSSAELARLRGMTPSKTQATTIRGAAEMARSLMGQVDASHWSSIRAAGAPMVRADAVEPARVTFDVPDYHIPTIDPYDPERFYWSTPDDERDGARCWQFTCDRFPHGGDGERFDMRVLVRIPESGDVHETIRIHVRASRLPDPFVLEVGLDITVEDVDTLALVTERLELDALRT